MYSALSPPSICVPVAQWKNIVVVAQKVVGSIPGNTHTEKMYSLNAL